MSAKVKIVNDNRRLVEQEMEKQAMTGLEKIGLTAEGYAKKNCPVDTGRLRNSITHVVDDMKVVIGTNVDYASWVELGRANPDATHDRDEFATPNPEGSEHHGHNPQPFLKPAITEHISLYKSMLISSLKGE